MTFSSEQLRNLEEKVTEEEARQVLYFFGDTELGWEAGGFTTALMSAIARADMVNQEKLRLGFPGLVAAMLLVKHHTGGLDLLRGFVR